VKFSCSGLIIIGNDASMILMSEQPVWIKL
jgi:hypothetical protein